MQPKATFLHTPKIHGVEKSHCLLTCFFTTTTEISRWILKAQGTERWIWEGGISQQIGINISLVVARNGSRSDFQGWNRSRIPVPPFHIWMIKHWLHGQIPTCSMSACAVLSTVVAQHLPGETHSSPWPLLHALLSLIPNRLHLYKTHIPNHKPEQL